MSNDPSPRGTTETLALADQATERPDTSRRTFLQYVGAGIALTSLPAIPGCAVQGNTSGPAPQPSAADLKALADNAQYVNVLRRDDLLSFQLGLANMYLETTSRIAPPAGLVLNGNYWIQRTSVDQPAFLIVNFQPQHIIEAAVSDAQNAPAPPGGRVTQDARISQGSRLVFAVPSNVMAIPFELGPLLTALASYGLQVAANALPAAENAITTVPILYGGGSLGNLGNIGDIGVANQTTANANPLIHAMNLGRARRATKAFLRSNPGTAVSKKVPRALVRDLSTQEATGVTNDPVTNEPISIVNPGPIEIGPAPTYPVEPGPLETAIELPWRLIISPNGYAQFTHETADPPPALGDDSRVELWHTKLTTPEPWQQTIRALWTRDPDFFASDAGDSHYFSNAANPTPFLASLYDQDRGDIVHLSSNYTLTERVAAIEADRLMLSTLGGWLDAHGSWSDPPAGGAATNPSMVAWDHVADMGRDNYVRVVDFGYLYPWGHKAVIVRVTERKFEQPSPQNPNGQPGIAYLWQREYVIVKEPLRTYDQLPQPYNRNIPFTSVKFKTLITPTLDVGPSVAVSPQGGTFSNSVYLNVGGKPFPFEVEAFDQEGNKLAFNVAAIFVAYDDSDAFNKSPAAAVAEINKDWSGSAGFMSDLKSQRIAYATHTKPDDTRYTTVGLGAIAAVPTTNTTVGVPGEAPFVPQLGVATLAVDTIKGVTGDSTPQPFTYGDAYAAHGFDPTINVGEVLLKFTNQYDASAKQPAFDVQKKANKSGGFVAPSMAVSALSRKHGLVSGNANLFAAGGDTSQNLPGLSGMPSGFNPNDFFNLLDSAQLFGCISIANIIKAVDPGASFFTQAPKFLTQALQPVEELLSLGDTLVSLSGDLSGDVTNIQNLIGQIPASPPFPTTGPVAALMAKASAMGIPGGAAGWLTQLSTLQSSIDAAVAAAKGLGKAVSDAITAIGAGGAGNDPTTQAGIVVNSFKTALTTIQTLGGLLTPGLPTSIKLPVDPGSATQAIQAIQAMATWMTSNAGTIDTIIQAFLTAEDAIENLHIKIDWSPTLTPWPPGAAIFTPNDPNGFHVGVEIRGKESNGQPAGADVYASLSNFQLGLIGANPVITLDFGELSFKASTDADPDINCVFNGLHFGGALSFVEVLRKFIPLDGFSDPPDVTVDTTGISASFGLPLPSIAVGMFALENLSFNAGFQIPFIGKSLSVDFSFCTRESPFVLTVSMLGGGGFVGITITPSGVQKLEISLEATACLAIDLGIASGSISISVGIYLCIEANDCKLSGFVKFDGNVDVLGGLISASISLDLELSYESKGNKVIGTASLEIHVAVLCFGVTVSCTVTRKFHGDNTDPTFRDVMQPYACPTPILNDGTCSADGLDYPWNDYVNAFVPLAAP